jgi:hypothetical protein
MTYMMIIICHTSSWTKNDIHDDNNMISHVLILWVQNQNAPGYNRASTTEGESV